MWTLVPHPTKVRAGPGYLSSQEKALKEEEHKFRTAQGPEAAPLLWNRNY